VRISTATRRPKWNFQIGGPGRSHSYRIQAETPRALNLTVKSGMRTAPEEFRVFVASAAACEAA